MADWENLRHLAALAEGGSLSAAARRLGVEHATVARRVAALEAELGLRLVDRRGRRLSLTDEGARIAAIAAQMEAHSLAVARLARAARPGLEGEVTISAPPALAAELFARPLAAWQRRHPEVRLCLLGEHRQASLARREADIALRLSRPEEDGLVISRLSPIRFHFYAAAGYVAATAPAAWTFIAYDESMAASPQARRLEAFAAGRPVRFRGGSLDLQRVAAQEGLGVAILPEFLGDGAPGLVRLPDQGPPLTRDLWLAVHRDLHPSPLIRAVTACLRQAAAMPRPAPAAHLEAGPR